MSTRFVFSLLLFAAATLSSSHFALAVDTSGGFRNQVRYFNNMLGQEIVVTYKTNVNQPDFRVLEILYETEKGDVRIPCQDHNVGAWVALNGKDIFVPLKVQNFGVGSNCGIKLVLTQKDNPAFFNIQGTIDASFGFVVDDVWDSKFGENYRVEFNKP